MNLNTHKSVVIILAIVGLLVMLIGVTQKACADPGMLFVTPDGSGTDCTQDQPCDLQTALSQAVDDDTIYVAGGTYTGTDTTVITITKSVTLYGGWDGSPTGPLKTTPFLMNSPGKGPFFVTE